MQWFQRIQRRIEGMLQKRKLDADMAEEMRSHIEMRTRENIEAGMPADEARYAAIRQFGWVDNIQETCREQRGVTWLEHLVQDLRYGARMLRRNVSVALTTWTGVHRIRCFPTWPLALDGTAVTSNSSCVMAL